MEPSCRGERSHHLQIGHALLEGLRVLPQRTLLLQELGVVAVGGRLEEAVVEHVGQRLGQRTQDLLLGLPHRGVRVETKTLLQDREEEQEEVEEKKEEE